MEALVLKSTGKWYQLKLKESGEVVEARVRGKLRLKGFRSTNPVAVGDRVEIEQQGEDYVISEIHPRDNFLLRKSVNLSKRSHVIASNIDQVLLICTLKDPETSFTFIDRILVTCEAYDLKVLIVVNKIDLIGDDDKSIDELAYFCETYVQIGYPVLLCSAQSGKGLEELKELTHNKVSLLAGHSGVGKSSLANVIQPGLNLHVSEISDYHQTGTHTTTFAEMHPISSGGYLVDTPGIRGFGIIDIDRKSLSHFFPEMKALLGNCKFHNCQHTNEPGCAVIEAYENAEISPDRYRSYVTILEEDEEQNYRK